jgi:FkbM family methyltransferase
VTATAAEICRCLTVVLVSTSWLSGDFEPRLQGDVTIADPAGDFLPAIRPLQSARRPGLAPLAESMRSAYCRFASSAGSVENGHPTRSARTSMWSLLEFFPEGFLINIVDIGAALSERPSYQGIVNAGRGRIIGFEPDAAECRRLNERYGSPHQFFPHFVGDGNPGVFHETNWNLTGSLLEPNRALARSFANLDELLQPKAQHAVSTSRLDDIPGIDDVDFIKIDIQGAELMVFRNAPRIMAQTLMIQTEVEFVEIYKGQPLFADVDTFLRQSGYQFHTFLGFGMRAFKPLTKSADPNAGFNQLLWSDAIYLRDWLRFDVLATLKLKKLAVLVHDILGSYDLCHVVLEEIDRREARSLAPRYRERLGVVNGPSGA